MKAVSAKLNFLMQNDRGALRLLWEILFTRLHIRFTMLLASSVSALFGIFGPLFQRQFVDQLSHSTSFSQDMIGGLLGKLASSPEALLASTFLCILVSLTLAQLVTYLGTREAIVMQKKLSHRLYQKMLNLKTETLAGTQVGEIVSIYATDIPGSTILLEQSLPQGASILFPLIFAPLVLIHFFYLPALTTYLTIFGVISVNFIMAHRQSVYFYLFKKLAAERVGFVNEWIQNLRTLRILGWMESFENKIFELRRIETTNRIRMLNNGQSMNAIASSVTFLLNGVCIAAVVKMNQIPLSAGALLALLWIVGVFLTRPFRQLPWFFTFVFDAWTSVKRVERVMAMVNLDSSLGEIAKPISGINRITHSLSVHGLSLTIGKNKILDQIDLDVLPGEFVAIVGRVGSGKSLLLQSLMGETSANFMDFSIFHSQSKKNETVSSMGLAKLRRHFSYVPQEGFIMSASLRDNVGFEYDLDTSQDARMIEALADCQFHLDQERMSLGLNTEIGERGVNLSGGQKQRVSLARVHFQLDIHPHSLTAKKVGTASEFSEPSILLLDDCLAAVDVDTERKIVDELFLKCWGQRTRILVTHRLSVLPKVDRVIFLDRGAIIAQGPFETLMKTHQEFKEFAASISAAAPHGLLPEALITLTDAAVHAGELNES